MTDELQAISDSIRDNYDYGRYIGITEENSDEVLAVKCTWCGHWAPTGVPIKHKKLCSRQYKEA